MVHFPSLFSFFNTPFLTSCLFFYHPNPFRKDVYTQRICSPLGANSFFPFGSKFFLLKTDPYCHREAPTFFDRVASFLSVSIPPKLLFYYFSVSMVAIPRICKEGTVRKNLFRFNKLHWQTP